MIIVIKLFHWIKFCQLTLLKTIDFFYFQFNFEEVKIFFNKTILTSETSSLFRHQKLKIVFSQNNHFLWSIWVYIDQKFDLGLSLYWFFGLLKFILTFTKDYSWTKCIRYLIAMSCRISQTGVISQYSRVDITFSCTTLTNGCNV